MMQHRTLTPEFVEKAKPLREFDRVMALNLVLVKWGQERRTTVPEIMDAYYALGLKHRFLIDVR
jgi:hypothetical protein